MKMIKHNTPFYVFIVMEDPTVELPTDLDSCHSLIRELLATLRQQGLLIGHMQHQLERLLRQRDGRSSETIDPDQLPLFAADISPRPTRLQHPSPSRVPSGRAADTRPRGQAQTQGPRP